MQKRDVERGGAIKIGLAKWLMARDCGEFVRRANEGRDIVAEIIAQARRDFLFECRRVFRRRFKNHIAARDERFDIRKTERFKQRAQMIHLDGMPADVDRAEKCNPVRHPYAPRSITTAMVNDSAIAMVAQKINSNPINGSGSPN